MTTAEICNKILDIAMNRNLDTTSFIENLNLTSPEVDFLIQRLLTLEDEHVRLKKQLVLWFSIKRGFSPLIRLWNFLKSFLPNSKAKIKARFNPQPTPVMDSAIKASWLVSFVGELLQGRVVLFIWAPRDSHFWKGNFPAQLFGVDSFFVSVSQEASQHRVHVISPETPSEVSEVIGRYLDLESAPSRKGLIQALFSELGKR